jgi:hypothetical protein
MQARARRRRLQKTNKTRHLQLHTLASLTVIRGLIISVGSEDSTLPIAWLKYSHEHMSCNEPFYTHIYMRNHMCM